MASCDLGPLPTIPTTTITVVPHHRMWAAVLSNIHDVHTILFKYMAAYVTTDVPEIVCSKVV